MSSGLKLRNGLSISASIVVSFLILFGITQAQKTGIIETEPGFEELRSVVLPTPPPPPPQMARPIETPPSQLTLDVSLTDNPIQFSYSLTPISPVARPPKFEPVFDFSPDAFKPTLQDFQPRQVFNKAEVDQPPIAVYKKIPEFNQSLMGKERYAEIYLMYIVNNKGSVEAVSLTGSGGERFDEVVMDGVRKWRFKPAIKDGKKVNCWVRQRVILKKGGDSSPFSL